VKSVLAFEFMIAWSDHSADGAYPVAWSIRGTNENTEVI